MKRHIIVELDSHETTTPSVYMDVFGYVRDRETLARVGRWQEMPQMVHSSPDV
ncbi:hypothetical protein J2Y46_002574 [Microbacterium sp. BE35]|uniref:hypothetical protein n=1 Tax=Microbacterium sp. BE35 TaxID=2817773 RepID=UPI0028586697|nr:hypothetical protein [Microbacterium sp. BE35]MDR7189748.1 hypothetical protein [Microbacterium sp. BE35]